MDNVHAMQIYNASCNVCQLSGKSIGRHKETEARGLLASEDLFTPGLFRRYCMMFPFSIHSEIITSSGPRMYAPSKGRVFGFESLFHMITSRQNLCHEPHPLVSGSHAEKNGEPLLFSLVARYSPTAS